MKKSISVWSFPFDWDLDRKLALAHDAGFAGFEIDLTADGPVSLKSTDADLAVVRRQFDAAQRGVEPGRLDGFDEAAGETDGDAVVVPEAGAAADARVKSSVQVSGDEARADPAAAAMAPRARMVATGFMRFLPYNWM